MGPPDPAGSRADTTADLLDAVRRGDERARDQLVARYHPLLTRWAHGRLPVASRQLAETADLVQVTLIRALNHIERFESRREGAFLAYLRQILLNAIRDEIRRSAKRRGDEPMDEELPSPTPGLLDEAIGRDVVEAYEAALLDLPEKPREAVILRVELSFTYEEVAAAVGFTNGNAARMAVTRALARLAEAMDEHRRP